MLIKVSEATPLQLDYMVGYIRGEKLRIFDQQIVWPEDYSPSTDWALGGPIIQREEICVLAPVRGLWRGRKEGRTQYGPTPLVAAMRCYVSSKLGDEVEIPEELK